jgi:hypothetical protein
MYTVLGRSKTKKPVSIVLPKEGTTSKRIDGLVGV